VPKDSVIQYETALKTDSFLVMAHGPAAEIARTKTILGTSKPALVDLHIAADTAEPAVAAVGSPVDCRLPRNQGERRVLYEWTDRSLPDLSSFRVYRHRVFRAEDADTMPNSVV
jgi:hypothetical protein